MTRAPLRSLLARVRRVDAHLAERTSFSICQLAVFITAAVADAAWAISVISTT